MLTALLSDREASIRLTAVEALGKIGDQKAEPFLLQGLHDSDPTVREAAARSLGRLSAVNVNTEKELVALLEDSNASVRRAAAQALGDGEQTLELEASLAGLLRSPDATIREAAGHALLLVDSREAFSALSEASTDSDPVVRQWAVAALGESGDVRAVSVLMDRLRHDASVGVRVEAAYRLRFVGDGSGAADLETVVQQDDSLDVKRWVRKSQSELGRGPIPVQRLD